MSAFSGPSGAGLQSCARAPRGTFFSIGGLLAALWQTRSPMTPWVCASSVLTAGAIWDRVRTGGPIDFVLLGLAGYELVIGLTEEPAAPALARMPDPAGDHAHDAIR